MSDHVNFTKPPDITYKCLSMSTLLSSRHHIQISQHVNFTKPGDITEVRDVSTLGLSITEKLFRLMDNPLVDWQLWWDEASFQHCGRWPVVLSPGWNRMWPSERARSARVNSRDLWRSRRLARKWEFLSFHPCGTSRVLLHAVKSYDMGPSRFTFHPRGRCVRIFIALKNPSPWLGSNPQPLDSVASTLTTTPSRRRWTIHNTQVISHTTAVIAFPTSFFFATVRWTMRLWWISA
jgi:hypothetical protein